MLSVEQLLNDESRRINSPAFIADDPVQFPRKFEDVRDIEISSLLCSAIAWGNRRMICRDCEKLMQLMHYAPYRFMRDKEYEELDHERNIHRTFFVRNLKHFLKGLYQIYEKYHSLENFAHHLKLVESQFPAWDLVKGLNEYITDSRCLPQNLNTTALKRVNMALRWLVRNDGIVDIGCWNIIHPSQLFIPLDVHVTRTAYELGLLSRKTADRRAAVELTRTLKTFCPEDPVKYDFALFGIGMGL